MEARITELEIKLGLTEDHLEELNRTVFRQQQQIDLLDSSLSPVHTFTTIGVYTLSLTAINEAGCSRKPAVFKLL